MKSRDRICFFKWDFIKVKHQPLMATSGTMQPSRSGNVRGDSLFCLTRVSVSNPNWNGDTATRRPKIRHDSTRTWILWRNMYQHQVFFRFLFQKVADMVENSRWKKREHQLNRTAKITCLINRHTAHKQRTNNKLVRFATRRKFLT